WWFWEQSSGGKPFARSGFLDVQNILSNHLLIVESQAGRVFPNLLQLLPIVGFLGLHDEIANAKLLDEGHDFLLCSRADGKHGDDGGDAKNHAQHGQQRTQLVAGEIFESENEIGQPLLQGSWLGHGTRLHRCARSLNWNSDPSWD